MALKLHSATSERLRQYVTSNLDPTAIPPEWAFLPCGESPDAGTTYTSGQWETAWSVNRAQASTPTLGGLASVAVVKLDVGTYQAWLVVTAGSDEALRMSDIFEMSE